MKKKEIVALILAGGQGSRLGALTKSIAKPAVAFGGKYKIIDFALSNCSNSGIDTVGVLTQYKPLELNAHIGIGAPWDLDMHHGGVSILPPYMHETGGIWYKGTANAVYQNLSYLEQYDPAYVLILSGDHIYKMDYSKMLKQHIAKGADATIAVIDVPYQEAKRFGIMNVNAEGRIIEFEEKPSKPKSTLASMGIYIFNYSVLKRFLQEDEAQEDSVHDFGKNIIPNMLTNFQKLYTYNFSGYWRDIGTIESIWDANMDLTRADNELDLFDDSWKIYSKSSDLPPQFTAASAHVSRALISEGCKIYGTVERSVIFPGVVIEEGACVRDAIIMSGCRISKGVTIHKAILGADVCVQQDNTIGNGEDIEVIAENSVIPPRMYTAKIVG